MNRSPLGFRAVFAVQLLGTIVFLIGLTQGGLTVITIAGALIILLSIVGLVLQAFANEAESPTVGSGSDG